MMCRRIPLPLLVALVQVFRIAALTNPNDFAALESLKDVWTHVPPNWASDDPCGDKWDGINCNNSRVVSITLASTNLSGQLSDDIGGLSELQILDLSYNKGMTGQLPPSIGNWNNLSSLILVGCGFFGPIPSSIGSLHQLVYLSLNLNKFSGEIPASIGKLSNLIWLDLAGNKLGGTIPVSKGSTPGLDMLVQTKHFHFGNNMLSGEIPSQLFSSKMTLIHLLLENNRLNGSIPSSLGLVKNLTVVRLDRNSLSGSVPKNLNNLINVHELFLANNNLTGPLPNLTGMNALNYVDMSNNSFDKTDFPQWFSSLESLTSLIMENTTVQGELPVSLFSLPQLQTVALKTNLISGALNISSNYSKQLWQIDLQHNLIDSFDSFTQQADHHVQVILVENPICSEDGTKDYCILPHKSNFSYSTLVENCTHLPCSSDKISSPTCKCSCPYSGNIGLQAPSFSNFENSSLYECLQKELMAIFKSHNQPVDSVSLSNLTKNIYGYPVLTLQIFPSGRDYFNRSGISGIGFMLSNQTFKLPPKFGPYYFEGNSYPCFAGSHNSSSTGLIIGAAIGGSVLVLLLLIAGVYAFRQKRRAETASKRSDPFASWDRNSNSGGVPQLKGARCFSFEELKKYTNNFSKMNDIGHGGYGKVYKGTLPNGQLIAIKRAQQGSTQGDLEFKTEIELLSRVHHKNVVNLVGFCFDQGEQMLVYEYITNGSLKDSLIGRTGIRLDWTRRLRIALGAARGLQYLHDLADPPIIHRDIKSNNVLLDDRLNAKIADFGLSKLCVNLNEVMLPLKLKAQWQGYMDPEYYMTQQLTEKSDVYSFGVLLLELLTGRRPLERGTYIVKEVKQEVDKTKDMYNLEAILDPIVASSATHGSIEKFVDIALICLEELGINRPKMSDVVKEIQNILELVGLNPNVESASTSDSYEGANKGFHYPYTNEGLFSYTGSNLSSSLEPK